MSLQCPFRLELLPVMPPTVFWPRPKVHSAIVQITLEPERRAAVDNRQFFHDFVRKLFLHRRKHLRGVLAATFKNQLDKPGIDALLSQLQLGDGARAEELSVAQMLELSKAIEARLPR